MHVYVSYVT